MKNKSGSMVGFIVLLYLIGFLALFVGLEDFFTGKFFQKPSPYKTIEHFEPSSSAEPIPVEQPGGQLWKYAVTFGSMVAAPFLIPWLVEKVISHDTKDPVRLDRGSRQKPELPPYLWGDSEDFIEAPVEENFIAETSLQDTDNFIIETTEDPPQTPMEPAPETPKAEETTKTDESFLPPVNHNAVTYKNLRQMLNPEKTNPLNDFLSQRAAVVLDQLAPQTSPIYKPEILKIVDITAKARQVLRLVIAEKILNALKDQRSEGKEKYLMGAIGFHMMLFADEPLTNDKEFLITDKYMGKPYIQIGANTYHLKQQKISASGYHELVSKFKEPVLELYLSTHFPEGTLASYQKHFQAGKLSHQFGIRETTNANIKKFAESLVDELAACC